MKCGSCSHENRPTARFCEGCGTPLQRLCTSCGWELRVTAKFCDECGTPAGGQTQTVHSASLPVREARTYTPKHLADKILQSRSALEGERKQVTVLFADVKGSMELAEQLDPEEWHQLLERFFAIITEGVHRFEGTVNQYTGDGIMALFGAPIAHEDHAQRACYAALHMRDALREFSREIRRAHGLDFSTRMGLNSGDVIVGRIGDDLRMDYTAQGHTVGLAQRMESLAEPNACFMTGSTAALVTGYFALDDLGEFTLKGVAEPVRVHQLAGIGQLRTRFDISRARGLSKFAGRVSEMATLNAALARALAGQGQVVGIVADAGTGKSRLCFEFSESCRAQGLRVRSATGVAHGKSIPLLPVLELYRGIFGITAQDDAGTAQQKIAGHVVRSDESLVASMPLLFDFLGVPDAERPLTIPPGPARQRALLSALRQLTIARSRREPEVILFEDLHWIDEVTGVFLANLVEAADGSRTLLVVNFRPEYHAEWTRRSYYQQLPLAPLGADAFAAMLGEALGPHPSVISLIARIHVRTAGNPFFAEEIVQSLVETGVLAGDRGAHHLTHSIDALALPPTVQLILAARIDRLGEREKSVLQTAAVIGRDFDRRLLQDVAGYDAGELDAALGALLQAEFLHETAVYPTSQYRFRHPLTQEVALNSQLRERRARVHAKVAGAVIALHANALDEQAPLLAQHFEAAGDLTEAIRWNERAATWLRGRDPKVSLRHWEHLIELVGETPASVALARVALQACAQAIDLGFAYALAFARGEWLYRRGKALAAHVNEPALEAGLDAAFARFAILFNEAEIALTAAEDALRHAPEIDDAGVYADLIYSTALTFANTGRIEEAVAIAATALKSGKVTDHAPIALSRMHTAHAMWLNIRGRLDTAVSAVNRAAELLHGQHAALHVVTNELVRCLGLRTRGFPDGSLERIAHYCTVAEASGAFFYRIYARVLLAEAHLAKGDAAAALDLIEEGTAIRDLEGGTISVFRALEGPRALALAAHGQFAEARAVMEAFGEGEWLTSFFYVERLVVHAEVLIATDGVRDAQPRIKALLSEASDLARRMKMLPILARSLQARAQLLRACGDEVGWERELREALRLYTEMGATQWIARITQILPS